MTKKRLWLGYFECPFSPKLDSFAQWRYSNQWSNREVLLLLVENYTQYPAISTWNTVVLGNFCRLFLEQLQVLKFFCREVNKADYSFQMVVKVDICSSSCLYDQAIKAIKGTVLCTQSSQNLPPSSWITRACHHSVSYVYGHIMLKAPVLVRSLKLSNIELC